MGRKEQLKEAQNRYRQKQKTKGKYLLRIWLTEEANKKLTEKSKVTNLPTEEIINNLILQFAGITGQGDQSKLVEELEQKIINLNNKLSNQRLEKNKETILPQELSSWTKEELIKKYLNLQGWVERLEKLNYVLMENKNVN